MKCGGYNSKRCAVNKNSLSVAKLEFPSLLYPRIGTKMSSLSLARDAVRTAIAALNPESGEDDAYGGYFIPVTGLAATTSVASNAPDCDESSSTPTSMPPLEAIDEYDATRVERDALRAWTTVTKPFSGYPDAATEYSEAEWHEVPDTELSAHSAVVAAAWYSCVKRYRFINYGNGPLAGGPKLIIELELMGGTALRHIVNVNQIKGVITKHPSRQAFVPERIEEVIIDLRRAEREYGFSPEQVKMKFSGPVNALTFQMELMSELPTY